MRSFKAAGTEAPKRGATPMTSRTPTRRVTASSVLVALYISSDRMLLGTTASNKELAKATGAGLGAISQALRDLKADGQIEVMQRHGVIDPRRFIVLLGEPGSRTYVEHCRLTSEYYRTRPAQYRVWRQRQKDQHAALLRSRQSATNPAERIEASTQSTTAQ